MFMFHASSFREVNYKTAKPSSRVIVRDHSGRCPAQYCEIIGPVIEQSDWLILVISPLI